MDVTWEAAHILALLGQQGAGLPADGLHGDELHEEPGWPGQQLCAATASVGRVLLLHQFSSQLTSVVFASGSGSCSQWVLSCLLSWWYIGLFLRLSVFWQDARGAGADEQGWSECHALCLMQSSSFWTLHLQLKRQ